MGQQAKKEDFQLESIAGAKQTNVLGQAYKALVERCNAFAAFVQEMGAQPVPVEVVAKYQRHL